MTVISDFKELEKGILEGPYLIGLTSVLHN